MTTYIPRANVPIIMPNGMCNPEWYKYFESRDSSAAPPDSSGDVETVNGISPDSDGNVQLDAGDVGADPAGTANIVMQAHLAADNPHPQYLLSANTVTQYNATSASKIVVTRSDGIIDGSLAPGTPNRAYASRTLFNPSDSDMVNSGLYIEVGAAFVNDGNWITV